MKCVKPFLLKTKTGQIFEVPCRRCMACRIAIAQEWHLRLSLELESYKEACFVTLTYNEENLPEGGSLAKEDVVKFVKRLRKRIYPKKIKTFYVGEYGDIGLRPHYHLIIFGWRPDELYYFGKTGKRILYAARELDELWKHGLNNVGVVEDASIGYVTKYCTKKLYGRMAEEVYGERVPPFLECSKGLGLDWALNNEERIIDDLLISRKGKKRPVPRYFLRKLGVEKHRLVEEHKKYEEKLKDLHKNLDDVELHKEVLKARCQREKNLKSQEQINEAVHGLRSASSGIRTTIRGKK